MIFNSSKIAFYFFIIPIAIIYTIYSPIGISYGIPKYQHFISFFATTPQESVEFLTFIPIRNYIYSSLIIPLLLIFRYLSNKYPLNIYKNKNIIYITIILMIYPSPLSFIKESIESIKITKNELHYLQDLTKKNDWKNSQFAGKYINYVIIIGESARRDYLNAYGYPINNTPYMSNSDGILIDGLTAPDTYTIGSLRLMLTKPNKSNLEPNYNLNVVDLIKSANINTFWLSNQGFIGIWDTPVTSIANKSNYKFFSTYGDFGTSDISDFILVDKLKELLKKNKSDIHPKVYFLHLLGSHLNPCDRIKDYHRIIKIKDLKYDQINCYTSSIKKTDNIISKIYNLLNDDFNKNGNSFSLLYFSDHGLAHELTHENKITLTNPTNVPNKISKYHYDIPLFMTASDIKNRTVCHSFKSGLNFTEALANWIGIKNEQLGNYNLFDCKDDSDDYGFKEKIMNISLDDPAIDIRGK